MDSSIAVLKTTFSIIPGGAYASFYRSLFLFILPVLLFLFPFDRSLNAEDVSFSSSDHCVAYRTNKSVLFIASMDVVGKNCSINTSAVSKGSSYSIEVTIPTDKFDSGNSSRDSNVAEILKYDVSPNLIFHADGIPTGIKSMKNGDSFPVKGALTIGKVAYPVDFIVKVQGEGEKAFVSGSAITRFTAFKIEPPTIGLGGSVIKASDYLELHLHILLARVNGL